MTYRCCAGDTRTPHPSLIFSRFSAQNFLALLLRAGPGAGRSAAKDTGRVVLEPEGGSLKMRRRIALLVTLTAVTLMTGRASGQKPESLAYYGVPPDQLADVIVVFTPHINLGLHAVVPGEQVVQGSIVRIDKGVAPQLIVNTPNTIVGPLQAGVPVKLFLKSFKDRNVHYIIAVYPEPLGGKP